MASMIDAAREKAIGPLSKDRAPRIRPAVATRHICRVEAARPSVQPEPQPQPPVATARAREAAPSWQVWTALWIVYVVWGSTYLAIRVADRTLPALLTSGARFLLAGAIVYTAIALRRGRDAVRVTRRQVLACAVAGSLLVTGGNGLVMVGEEHVASGIAALLIAAVPLWVVVFRRAAGEHVSATTLAGVALGFLGVALLFLPGGGGTHGTVGGYVALFFAAVCWALGSFVSPRLPLPSDTFLSTAIQMLAGGVTSVVAGLARGEAGAV